MSRDFAVFFKKFSKKSAASQKGVNAPQQKNFLGLRVSQNFSFGKATLNFWGKSGL
jgi:hypothetical protein